MTIEMGCQLPARSAGTTPAFTMLDLPLPHAPSTTVAPVLKRLLAACDDGTGADPVLLAHLADRAGNTALAESVFAEESWRECGPAMRYRLAKLYEATNRPAGARAANQRFLELWSMADAD